MRNIFTGFFIFSILLVIAIGAGMAGETNPTLPETLIGQWLFVPETEAEYEMLDTAGEIELEFRYADAALTICLGENEEYYEVNVTTDANGTIILEAPGKAEKILITISGESRISIETDQTRGSEKPQAFEKIGK